MEDGCDVLGAGELWIPPPPASHPGPHLLGASAGIEMSGDSPGVRSLLQSSGFLACLPPAVPGFRASVADLEVPTGVSNLLCGARLLPGGTVHTCPFCRRTMKYPRMGATYETTEISGCAVRGTPFQEPPSRVRP